MPCRDRTSRLPRLLRVPCRRMRPRPLPRRRTARLRPDDLRHARRDEAGAHGLSRDRDRDRPRDADRSLGRTLLRGDDLPGRRGILGRQASRRRGLYRLARRGSSPPRFHRQRDGVFEGGRADRPLRRTSRSRLSSDPRGGGPRPPLHRGFAPRSAGAALLFDARLFGRNGSGRNF